MIFEYVITHIDTHDSGVLPRWTLWDKARREVDDMEPEQREKIDELDDFQHGYLGSFDILSDLMQAIAEHQWQQNKTLEEATPEPAPLDPGPRPGSIRDMALQKIK